MNQTPSETIVCDYPSQVIKYGRLRVVHRDGEFYLQWFAGVAYPPKKTSERRILSATARSHWTHAAKLRKTDDTVTAIHYTRYPKGHHARQ